LNILNTLTLRSLKLNRRRTIVTIIAIILSGAMICGTFTLAASFQDLFVQRAIKTDGNFHATFHSVYPEQIKYITENAYTKTAMLSRNLGFARFEQSTYKFKPYFYVKEYDATAFQHMPIELTAGRFPEKAGEIVLSEEIKKRGGEAYQIGETITLEFGKRLDEKGRQLADGTSYEKTERFVTTDTKTYTITGFIAKPHFENFNNIPGFTVVTYLDQDTLTPNDAVNVSILGKKARDIYDKIPEIAENAGIKEYSYNNELLKWMGLTQNDYAKEMLYSVTGILIALIVAGTVIVIYNSFAISVSERKKQFGMLASTGATPGQIRKTVFFEGALLGLVGIPLGILSGIGGIGVTLNFVNRLLSDMMSSMDITLRLVISPAVILATAVFTGLIIFLSAYIPAKRAAATSPIESIRLNRDIKINGKTVKTSKLTRLLFGIEGEIALKNLKRNRRRYRATVLSLIISIVLFIAFSTFINYSYKSTELYYQDITFDLSVLIDGISAEEQKEFFEQVIAFNGVERYSLIRELQTESLLARNQFGLYIQENHIDKNILPADEKGLYQHGFHITALGEQEFNKYTKENGLDAAVFQDTQNLKGILINKSIMQDGRYTEYEPLQIKAGDKLRLTDLQYNEETPPTTFSLEVGAVTDTHPMGVSAGNFGYSYIIVSEEVFDAIHLTLQKGNQSYEIQPQLYLCSENSTEKAEQIRAIFDQHYGDHGSLYLYDVQAEQQDIKQVKTMASIFLYGFITLITLIGVTNIFNTISTNVALRRREFAMLKSVGLTPQGFNKMINYESIFYGLKALLYGLPVAFVVTMLLYNGFVNMFQFAFFLPWKEMIACVIGVFVIIFITMLHASSKLKHENIIDALKEENL